MDNTQKTNAMTALLQQALALSQQSVGIPVLIDYEAITKAAVRAARDEAQRWRKDPRVMITQNEAHQTYGKYVITHLVKGGYLQQYKYGIREAYDRDGEKITVGRGVIYYKVVEIEEALEKGNVLKGMRRPRMINKP